MEEVYKQTVSCDCFHFLTVVIWLRSHSSEPFSHGLAARFRPAFKQKRIAGDGPSSASACEEMTYCHAPEVFRTRLPPFIVFTEMSSLDSSQGRRPVHLFPSRLFLGAHESHCLHPLSQLEPRFRAVISQDPRRGSSHRLGHPECDPDQPHQLSPLGLDLG